MITSILFLNWDEEEIKKIDKKNSYPLGIGKGIKINFYFGGDDEIVKPAPALSHCCVYFELSKI